MTGQGVNRSEFSSQLATVKSSYNLLEDMWPKSLLGEEVSFLLAIHGWDMALTVWKNQVVFTFGGMIFDENINILLDIDDFTSYLDLSADEIRSLTYDQAIGVLFSEACDNFDAGKSGVREEFK